MQATLRMGGGHACQDQRLGATLPIPRGLKKHDHAPPTPAKGSHFDKM
jgi:hypothetical protein